MLQIAARTDEVALYEAIAETYDDPLQFVRMMFPWGEEGPLRPYREPDTWQIEFLEWLGDEIKDRAFDGIHPVMPIRAAVSSGHGIGKGALTGMLVAFLMSTRRDAKVLSRRTQTPSFKTKPGPTSRSGS